MKLHELVDTFDAASPALSYSGPATRTDGRLALPYVDASQGDPETGMPPEVASVSSVDLYDLTASRVDIEVAGVSLSNRATLTVTVANQLTESGGAASLWFDITGGIITAARYIEQNGTTGWAAPFDPVAHRWLSIRHEPGVIVWATSHDGLEWTDRALLATNMLVDAMELDLRTYIGELNNPEDDDGLPTTSAALLDNLNAPPPSTTGDDPATIIGTPGAPNLAVDVMPTSNEHGTFVLDVSELDGIDLLGWGLFPGGWVNVVCDVTAVRIGRGMTRALGPLLRPEAGECAIELVDRERRFDPTVNADAIHPGTPIRVRAWAGVDPAAPEWSTVLFVGKINGDGITVAYSQTDPPSVSINASDVIARLARWEAAGTDEPGVGEGDNLLERVQRVLAEVDIENGVALAPDSLYAATLAATTLSDAGDALAAALEAEQGRVWATVDGRLAVRSRGSQLSGPVRGTLSDWHGETIAEGGVHCCYVAPVVRYSPDQLVNRVVAARRGGDLTVQLDDEPSQARFDVAAVKTTALELETDAQLEPWAGAMIRDHTEPRVRVDAVSPAPWSAPEAWQAVLATDIGDRWYFRLHPTLGPTVQQGVGVLAIEHDITPEGWAIKWVTTWAPEPGENPTGWFLLDVSSLDGGDLLAPFS